MKTKEELKARSKAKKKEESEWWRSKKKHVLDQKPEQTASNLTVKELQDMVNTHEEEPMQDMLKRKTFLPLRIDDKWDVKEDAIIDKYQRRKDVPLFQEEEEKGPSTSEKMGERRQLLEQYKSYMAMLTRKIKVNPGSVDTWSALVNLLKESNHLVTMTVRRFAVVNLRLIFHDLIPDYRFNKDLLNKKMYKEKLEVVKGEFVVLEFYRKTLKLMEVNLHELEKGEMVPAKAGLRETILDCYGNLLIRHPRFNHGTDIAAILISYLNHKDASVRKLVLRYIGETLEKDSRGITSLTIVRKISSYAKSRKYNIHAEMIRILQSLNMKYLKNEDAKKEVIVTAEREIDKNVALIKKLKTQADLNSRKQKKENKKKAILKNKIASVESGAIQKQVEVQHSAILELVLHIHFEILKRGAKLKTLGAVLEGIAKFASLINIEYFIALLNTFSDYMDQGVLSFEDGLHCVETIFTIVAEQDEALAIDPTKFYAHFYNVMSVITRECCEKNVRLMIRVFNQMLTERKRKMSACRVLAFTKRWATVALSLPHHAATIPFLVTLSNVLKTFICNEALLATEQEGCPGSFNADTMEPDLANAAATSLYELVLLSNSHHPDLMQISKSVLDIGTARESTGYVRQFNPRFAHKLYSDYDPNKMVFKPAVPNPEKHLKSCKKAKRKKSDDVTMSDLDLFGQYEQFVAGPEPELKRAKYAKVNFFMSTVRCLDIDEVPSRACLTQTPDYANQLIGFKQE